ncbi:MAG: acyl-CoA dehydrogenase family protein [Deltaproteobacteria bacterium]|nr:acyl-CoA dehydrogenase family protein [Deltaproteobacteria bacterium]
MDFRFTEEEETFRKEVKAWLKEVIPQRWYDLGPGIWEETEEGWAISRTFQKQLGQKGWLAPGYPKQYGGSEMTIGKQLVLSEELARSDAPVSVETAIAVSWVGPTIMLFGNDEQKDKYVKGVATGDLVFCLGYSETEAGSDLASLKTSAVEDGDEFVINGQKIWTSYAHYADYCWLAARTDPTAPRKYDGVSMLIVDMKSPGITVRPIINILERHSFNEVFFDNVRIPKENLVGEKDKGWYELMIALDHERSPSGGAAGFAKVLEVLVDVAKKRKIDKDPNIRQKIAQVAVAMEVSKVLGYRVAWMYSKGLHPNYEASISIMKASETLRHQAEVGAAVLGPYAHLRRESKWTVELGVIERMLLSCLSIGIGGGTNEIQRNIVAQRGLGLPRQKM